MLSDSVSESEESSFDSKWTRNSSVFFGGEGVMSGDVSFERLGGIVGGSSIVELGVLGDKGRVLFSCCNEEEATGEAGAVVTVVVGVFPNGALDLK